MAATITPGPWIVERLRLWGGNLIVDGGRNRIAADIHNEANARLIAAAPDLLAALRGLIEAIAVGPAVPHLESAAKHAIAALVTARQTP